MRYTVGQNIASCCYTTKRHPCFAGIPLFFINFIKKQFTLFFTGSLTKRSINKR